MAIATEFDDELQQVDAGKSFTFNSGFSDYGENEWSVSGYTVNGGSDDACEHGAAEALYNLGYRFYTPEKTVRPASLPAEGVTLARQEFVFPFFSLFYNYGYASWGAYKNDAFNRWTILNAADDGRFPIVHAWGPIITAIDAEDSFFTNNPTYYKKDTIASTTATFDLSITGADYTALVDRVAQYVVDDVGTSTRYGFDPTDGDGVDSDTCFQFAKDVLAVVHQTKPNVNFGLYAYSNHNRAPSFTVNNMYVQVALGFNDGGIGYSALVDEWAQAGVTVGLRGYGLIAAQDEWGPFQQGLCADNSFSSSIFNYADYIASGAKSMKMESTGNQIPALVGQYTLIRYLKDGTTTHADVRDDMAANLPGFTAEVKDLYEFWGANSLNPSTISTSYDKIAALPVNTLTTEIKRYWTWYRNNEDRVEDYRTANGKNGIYYSRLEQSLRYGKALQDDGIIHGYAYSRQEANANVDPDRNDLKFNSSPHWSRHGEYPPDSLFDSLKTKYQQALQRPSELNDTTLVLVEVTPNGGETGGAANFITDAGVDYAYVGPGTITRGGNDTVYGSGLHTFSASGLVEYSGGHLFLKCFPQFSTDAPGHGGNRFMYIPKSVRGRPYITGGPRLTIVDGNGSKDYRQHVPPFDSGFSDPRKLQAGQSRVRWDRTRGTVVMLNCNPWISATHNRALMPKALAVREGLTILAEY